MFGVLLAGMIMKEAVEGVVIVGVATMTTAVEGGITGVDIMEAGTGTIPGMMIWVRHNTASTGLSQIYVSCCCYSFYGLINVRSSLSQICTTICFIIKAVTTKSVQVFHNLLILVLKFCYGSFCGMKFRCTVALGYKLFG